MGFAIRLLALLFVVLFVARLLRRLWHRLLPDSPQARREPRRSAESAPDPRPAESAPDPRPAESAPGQPASDERLEPRSPNEVLGVEPGANADQIRAAYQRLVRQYHPDRVATMAPELRELAERRTKQINAAYQQLERELAD